MGNWNDGVYCFFVHRSAKTAASDAETVTAQTDAARLKALDQLATANTESAQLRELNERFVRELRYAYGTTPISRRLPRSTEKPPTPWYESNSPSHDSYSRIHPVIIEYLNTTQIVPPHH